jgi:hypothetical protein
MSDQVKEDEVDGAYSTHGDEEACMYYFWRESQRPLGRPRRRWVDNIKMDLREIG